MDGLDLELPEFEATASDHMKGVFVNPFECMLRLFGFPCEEEANAAEGVSERAVEVKGRTVECKPGGEVVAAAVAPEVKPVPAAPAVPAATA